MSRLKNYGNKNSLAKTITLCVKAVTGVLGASLIITDSPIAALIVLCVGAVTNEIINLYKWK